MGPQGLPVGGGRWTGRLERLWPGIGAGEVLVLVGPAPVREGRLGAAQGAGWSDFALGRLAARLAMAEVGQGQGWDVVDGDVPSGRWGEPVFPAGLWGSIAHTRLLAAAIVGCDRPVGCDVEALVPDRRDLGPGLLVPEEEKLLSRETVGSPEAWQEPPVLELKGFAAHEWTRSDSIPLPSRVWLGILVRFCAKEAAWKALASAAIRRTGRPMPPVFDPKDFRVRLLFGGRLGVVLQRGPMAGRAMRGGWGLVAEGGTPRWCVAWVAGELVSSATKMADSG